MWKSTMYLSHLSSGSKTVCGLIDTEYFKKQSITEQFLSQIYKIKGKMQQIIYKDCIYHTTNHEKGKIIFLLQSSSMQLDYSQKVNASSQWTQISSDMRNWKQTRLNSDYFFEDERFLNQSWQILPQVHLSGIKLH